MGRAQGSEQWQGCYVGFSVAIFGGWAHCRGTRLDLVASVAGGRLGAGAGRSVLWGRAAQRTLEVSMGGGGSESRWVIVVQLWGGRGGTVSGVGAW
jgi:hypothetical protein